MPSLGCHPSSAWNARFPICVGTLHRVPDVRLRLLGSVRATVDGRPVDLGGPRQRAVLARLAIAGGEFVPIDQLVEAVWPEARPGDPTASLQSFVSRLRRVLQPGAGARDRGDVLVSGPTGYALRLPGDAVDTVQVERLLTEATSLLEARPARAATLLTEALAAWDGPPLVEYADQPWAEAEVARLTELRTVARERLLAARGALTDPAVLVPELEALVAEAPLREERWRLLVLALYRAHRQGDALAALRRARSTLADELGVDPGPALQALEQQVLTQDPALATATAATTAAAATATAGPTAARAPVPLADAGGASSPDLLERDNELAALDRILDHVLAGDGALGVVEGPAGIGKSALLGQLRRVAAARGITVLSARASRLEQDFSFGVARQLFEPLVATSNDGADLLDDAAAGARSVFDLHAGAPRTADDSLFAVLHGLYRLTTNAAARAPLLLVVDDLHWCDTGSVRFLAYLARRLTGSRVAAVVGYRTGEHHVLGGLLDELRNDPAAVMVRPVPLTHAAVADLLEQRLHAVPDDEFVTACRDGTTGNPLLVRQLLQGLVSDRVTPDRAHADVARARSSRAVSSMIMLRLTALPGAAIAVARALAVLGDGTPLPQLAELAGRSEEEAAGALADLVRIEIVRADPPLGFVHPLVRDAVYGDLPVGERELWHERAARLLDAAGRPAENVAAQLLLAPPRGAPWVVQALRRAADDAVRRGSSDTAVTMLRRALKEPPEPQVRADLLLDLGLIETTTDGVAACADLQAAYDIHLDAERRATAAIALTRTLTFAGEMGSPVRFADRALAALPPHLVEERSAIVAYQRVAGHMHGVDGRLWHLDEEPAVSGEGFGSRMLQASLAFERMCRARPREDSVPLARHALSDMQLFDSDTGLLWVSALTILDMADEDVLGRWQAMDAAATNRGSLFALLSVGIWGGWSLGRRGFLERAETSIRTAIDQLDLWQQDTATMSYAHGILARLVYDQGRADEARAIIGPSEAVRRSVEGDRLVTEMDAELLLDRGHVDAAMRALDAAVERTPHATNPAWRGDRLLWCRAAALAGRPAEALHRAHELVTLARTWGAPSTIGEALTCLGSVQEVLDAGSGIATLREAVAVLEASPRPIVRADALVALGLALGDQAPDEAAVLLGEAARTAVATGARRLTDRLGAARRAPV
jgi:DNA-binding SARP family transcriptional activator